jgi:hypothetical protein
MVRIAGLGAAVEGRGRGIRPGVQLISRGIRPRARRSTDWGSGEQANGKVKKSGLEETDASGSGRNARSADGSCRRRHQCQLLGAQRGQAPKPRSGAPKAPGLTALRLAETPSQAPSVSILADSVRGIECRLLHLPPQGSRLTMPDPSPLNYRVADLASRWQCSPGKVRAMISSGDLPCLRLGKLVRVPGAGRGRKVPSEGRPVGPWHRRPEPPGSALSRHPITVEPVPRRMRTPGSPGAAFVGVDASPGWKRIHRVASSATPETCGIR